MENSMGAPHESKNRNTIWPSNPTSGCVSKGNEITNSKRHLHPHTHSIIHNSQGMETTYVSINGWMDKENMVHTHIHTGILLSLKTEGNPAICNNMYVTRRRYVTWNNPDRCKCYHLYVETKENKRKNFKLIDKESRKVITRG